MIFVIAIVLSGVANLIVVPFWIMGFPHGFLLPVSLQSAWLILFVCLLLVVLGRTQGWAPSCVWRWLCVGLFALLLLVFRTEYPSVNGDGEYGAAGYLTRTEVGGTDPTHVERRLASEVNRLVNDVLPVRARFVFHVGMPERRNTLSTFDEFIRARQDTNNTWTLISLVVGVLTAVGVMRETCRMNRSEAARLGSLLFVLFSPPMLNMFGHFDSYWLAVIVVLLWFRIVADGGLSPRAQFGLSMVLGLIGVWAHPILVLLPLFTCAHLFFFMCRTVFGRWLPSAACLLGTGLGILPMASRGGAPDWRLLSPEMIPYFASERLCLSLATALPSVLLALVAVVSLCRNRLAFLPRHATAMMIFVAAWISFFTLNFALGPLDELNACVTGTMMLGAAWMLWNACLVNDRAILCAGLLSLYVFVPKSYVFSNAHVIDYFKHIQPYSICMGNRSASPYVLLALRCPVDDAKCRECFLEVLHEGAMHPLPLWDSYRLLNQQYYTAWNYEFGNQNEGRRQLYWLMDHEASSLLPLWFDGTRFTDRYENKAVYAIRRDSSEWIRFRLRGRPGDLDLQGMEVVLRKVESGEWTRREFQRWADDVQFKGDRRRAGWRRPTPTNEKPDARCLIPLSTD